VKHRPDWVVAAAMIVLLLIFGGVALAYLGAFKRKDSRPYGWWW
jgi:ammonia channel protein AmtB